jgi:hypothetical protein
LFWSGFNSVAYQDAERLAEDLGLEIETEEK